MKRLWPSKKCCKGHSSAARLYPTSYCRHMFVRVTKTMRGACSAYEASLKPDSTRRSPVCGSWSPADGPRSPAETSHRPFFVQPSAIRATPQAKELRRDRLGRQHRGRGNCRTACRLSLRGSPVNMPLTEQIGLGLRPSSDH